MDYEEVVRQIIGRELKATLTKFIILNPDPESELERIMDEVEIELRQVLPGRQRLRLVDLQKP
jgi:hypothetical protein